MEDALDVDFVVEFGLDEHLLIDSLQLFLDSVDFVEVAGVELFIDLEIA